MGRLKNFFLYIPRKIATFISFLKDVNTEMKKVRWATLKEMGKYTYVVILFAVIASLYFMGLDYAIEFVKGLFD